MNSGNGDLHWKNYLRKTKYPVKETALKKWAADNLSIEKKGDKLICRFELQGSTCNSGGTPFTLVLETDLVPVKGRLEIGEGRIEIPDADSEAAREMCSFDGTRGGPGTDRGGGQPRYEIPHTLAGKTLEKAIASLGETNPAGCVCSEAHRNHKWLWFLSAVHYALFFGSDRTV